MKNPIVFPIDLGVTRDSSIVKEAYQDLREYLYLRPPDPELLSTMMRIVIVEGDIHESTLKSQLQGKLFLILRRKSCIIK